MWHFSGGVRAHVADSASRQPTTLAPENDTVIHDWAFCSSAACTYRFSLFFLTGMRRGWSSTQAAESLETR